MTVEFEKVRRARKGTWRADDDRRVRQAVIIGRAEVELDDGTWIPALLVASAEQRNLGAQFAVYWAWSNETGGRCSRLVCYELL